MNRLSEKLIEKCRRLRQRGYSLGDISVRLGVSKSTLFSYVKDIVLRPWQVDKIETRRKEKNKNNPNPRKGKCLPGREIKMPQAWSDDLVHLVSHLMFDGRIDESGCIYYSKDIYQIRHMRRLFAALFKVYPKVQLRDHGVYGLPFYHVELADYIKKLSNRLAPYLNNGAPLSSKRVFLQAFFDDEGNVYYSGSKRRVRGYQKSRERLEWVRNLLLDFRISGTINKTGIYIEITNRENLENFAKQINFSAGIYLNPERKNSIWKEKISKKKILDLVLNSYCKN